MSRAYAKGPARIEANLTAFIDVTFLLIIFFILVAQISTTERPVLPLPRIDDSAAHALDREERLIINCTVGAGGALYLVGTEAFRGPGGATRLRDVVRQSLAASPQQAVAVRAERTLAYEHVQPVLDLLRELRAERVELVVVPPRDEGA